jgi:cyclophilin family peptidyl-prolyl cis-trans isomerase
MVGCVTTETSVSTIEKANEKVATEIPVTAIEKPNQRGTTEKPVTVIEKTNQRVKTETPVTVVENANQMVTLKTSMGDITLELYPEKAPATVKNFMQYVDDGFYKETIFHRVINTFMIQGGGFDCNMAKKETRAPVKNEAGNGLKNERGTIAMARTRVPDSATAQFFINTVDKFWSHRLF